MRKTLALLCVLMFLVFSAAAESPMEGKSLEELTDGGMNNRPFAQDMSELCLMCVDRNSLVPLAPSVHYGGRSSQGKDN